MIKDLQTIINLKERNTNETQMVQAAVVPQTIGSFDNPFAVQLPRLRRYQRQPHLAGFFDNAGDHQHRRRFIYNSRPVKGRI